MSAKNPAASLVVAPRRYNEDSMTDPKLRVLDEHERGQMRQWLANWQVAGPLLEQERTERVRALTDADAARMALDLWQFARADSGDNGEGILLVTQTLQKLANR